MHDLWAMQPIGQERASLCHQSPTLLQGLSLMTDGSKHCSLRSAQILVDRRNVQVSYLMPPLLQHTLHAHREGDLFIQLSSGPPVIFRCWGWEGSYRSFVRETLIWRGISASMYKHGESCRVDAGWGSSEDMYYVTLFVHTYGFWLQGCYLLKLLGSRPVWEWRE